MWKYIIIIEGAEFEGANELSTTLENLSDEGDIDIIRTADSKLRTPGGKWIDIPENNWE